ncbi:MAG: outer membrane beta-barrel protein [Candidatus Aminicenantes bacterium]|nr:outer membrane beta-barrel protein [Candidatus Aminicenantes bacterium]
MKKSVIMMATLAVGLIFTNTFGWAQTASDDPCLVGKYSFSVGAGMRNFSENLFKTVYDNSGMSYNLDLGVKVAKSLEAFLHTDYFKKDGELTYTKEKSTLTIIPIELGARYLIGISKQCELKLFPYLGAGAGYYMVKEENPIGNFDKKGFGFFVEVGLRYYPAGSFFIDAKIKDVFLKIKNDQGRNINTGGFAYMGAIGISF